MSSLHEVKYYKTALRSNAQASDNFACIGVGIAREGNSKTCAFDAISIQSIQKHEQAPLRRGSSSITSPKIWGGAKIFDFRWITLFLGDTASQSIKWLCVPKIWGVISPKALWLHLHKAGTLLFRNNTVQRYKGLLAVACSKPPALEACSDSVWYFIISFNAEYLRYKGACHDRQTDPLDAPLSRRAGRHKEEYREFALINHRKSSNSDFSTLCAEYQRNNKHCQYTVYRQNLYDTLATLQN